MAATDVADAPATKPAPKRIKPSQIALGIGTSHGPQLSTPPEEWGQRASADRRNSELAFRGAELMPAPSGNGYEVEWLYHSTRIAEQAASVASQDHDGVRMLMSFKCGVAVRRHFEVAQFACQIRLSK